MGKIKLTEPWHPKTISTRAPGLILQYHNSDKLGIPIPTFDYGSMFTQKEFVTKEHGSRVVLIVGVGTPREYYLWETFLIEEVEKDDGAYFASGRGFNPHRLI